MSVPELTPLGPARCCALLAWADRLDGNAVVGTNTPPDGRNGTPGPGFRL